VYRSIQDAHERVNEEATVGVGVGDDVEELVDVGVAVPLLSNSNGSKGLYSHFSERIERKYFLTYAFWLRIYVRRTHGCIVGNGPSRVHGAARIQNALEQRSLDIEVRFAKAIAIVIGGASFEIDLRETVVGAC
jgi:hypothetical protein